MCSIQHIWWDLLWSCWQWVRGRRVSVCVTFAEWHVINWLVTWILYLLFKPMFRKTPQNVLNSGRITSVHKFLLDCC